MASEAVPQGNSKGRGPGYPVLNGGDSKLPQHGGEGKNLSPKSDSKLNKGMEGPAYCGPGRYL